MYTNNTIRINNFEHEKGILNKKINFNCVFLFIILAFSFNFFYLIDSSIVNLTDINLILILVWSVLVFIQNGFKLDKKISKITLSLFLIYVVLSLTSSFQSHKLYNQPIIYGIRAQRDLIVLPLLFYPVASLYKKNKISLEDFKKTILLFSVVEMVVGYLQFILQNQVTFVNLYVSERYSSLRFGFDTLLLAFSMHDCLTEAIKGKNRVRNYIFVIASILFPIIVIRWRMVILQFLFSTLISFFIFQKLSNKKLFFGLLIIFGVILFLSSTVGQDMIGLLLGTNVNDTDSIREVGRNFYFETISKYPLFGGGFINILWNPSYVGAKLDQGIYTADNGAFGFMFSYGIFGIFLILLLYVKLIRESNMIYKTTHNQTYICYIIFTLCGFITVAPLGMCSSIGLPLLIIALYMERNPIKNEMIHK